MIWLPFFLKGCSTHQRGILTATNATINQAMNPSINQSINQSIYQSLLLNLSRKVIHQSQSLVRRYANWRCAQRMHHPDPDAPRFVANPRLCFSRLTMCQVALSGREDLLQILTYIGSNFIPTKNVSLPVSSLL